MIYFFYGSDRDKAREKAGALLDMLAKKYPEAEVFRISAESDVNTLDELIGGQGLFSKTHIVYCTTLFENEEWKEAFVERLGDIADSPNIFVLLEAAVDKKTVLALAEKAEKVLMFERKEKKVPEFNIFSLTDAFGARDKKKLWVLYQQARMSGAEPEEVHGILFWQLKSIFLATVCKTADEAGVKPFVWSKAKSFAKNYSAEELKNLSSKFISLYHDSRRGIHEFDIALERLILTI